MLRCENAETNRVCGSGLQPRFATNGTQHEARSGVQTHLATHRDCKSLPQRRGSLQRSRNFPRGALALQRLPARIAVGKFGLNLRQTCLHRGHLATVALIEGGVGHALVQGLLLLF